MTPRLLPSDVESELRTLIRDRKLEDLARLVDWARLRRYTYNDLQAASGMTPVEWENLMLEIDEGAVQ